MLDQRAWVGRRGLMSTRPRDLVADLQSEWRSVLPFSFHSDLFLSKTLAFAAASDFLRQNSRASEDTRRLMQGRQGRPSAQLVPN